MASKTTNQTNKSEIITPKKARQKRVAARVIAGDSLTDIGKDEFPHAKYPHQTMSNCVKQPGYQREIAALMDYNPEELRSMLAEELKTRKRDAVWTRQIELAMRSEAMLTDKQIQDVTQHTSVDEVTQKAQQAVDRLLAVHDDNAPVMVSHNRDYVSAPNSVSPCTNSDTEQTEHTEADRDRAEQETGRESDKPVRKRPTPSGKEVEATPGGE